MSSEFTTQSARSRSISSIPGITVGHASDPHGATGCSVVMLPERTVGAIDARGGACATHETDLLDPSGVVEHVDAFVLCGSSAPGLSCIKGVVDWHRAHGRGFSTTHGVVPIVPGAAIYDLSVGSSEAVVSADHAYSACQNASSDVARGNVGAGAGASVGKLLGPDRAMKSGIGSAGWVTSEGVSVGALAVVNAFGDICEDGSVIAGTRDDQDGPLDTQHAMISSNSIPLGFGTNTTLVVVATNATLNKAQTHAFARMSHAGLPRAVRPCHTQFDGDIVFAAATGAQEADLNTLGTLGARIVECAIIDAVLRADAIPTHPSASSLGWITRDRPE